MTSKFLKIILFCGAMFAASAQAEEVSVSVVGRGVNHNNAVLDGLQQAVAQVSGITIDVQSLSGLEEDSVDIRKDGEETGYSKLSQATQSAIASRINGYISSYNVLSSQKNEDGLYEAEMTVTIERYTSPGAQNNRYGLAVVGITSGGGKCFGGGLSAATVNDEATKALVSAFTATRKFSVLDRDEQLAYDLEKALIAGEDTAAHEQVKLGSVKGTDYIVTGKVKSVNIWQNVQNIALTGEKIYTRGAQATIEYKVLIFATRQVKVSSSVSVALSGQELSGKSCSDALALLMKKAADKISNDCIENIYPAMVINVKGENIYLNMGGESVKNGQIYEVNEAGETMYDPYTGESLGAEETTIAKIEVFDVKPKFSIAKVVEGKTEDIKVGQICRKSAAIVRKEQKKPAAPAKQEDYSLPLN